ncbi:hypothetical protein VSVS12_02859 [Vibrio scophthalmi]|uniref:Uncharacterized protein n=1 Tax=Vibrio scophthalmi TaxID=45658 RepID=A0A1B1NSD0_9VIBR|nr:hypothetical protein VSVS12_02859 [Vibrio scophthalmi]ANU35293.1 hypothetical protein VSVS05_00138 [Vibrio scophthalmi]ODS12508.1 hypothetical protein VSF3289_02822 [Vibrio scophthalmi]
MTGTRVPEPDNAGVGIESGHLVTALIKRRPQTCAAQLGESEQ